MFGLAEKKSVIQPNYNLFNGFAKEGVECGVKCRRGVNTAALMDFRFCFNLTGVMQIEVYTFGN